MNLALRVKRWRALRRAAPLTLESAEGTVVRATGVARAGKYADAFVPPIAGVPCVAAWSTFVSGKGQKIERWLIRPFLLETDTLDVIVDASHIDFLFPVRSEGNAREISIADGATITVIGTLLFDGVERPDDDELTFRDSFSVCNLVGNKRHPVVITASVSDTDAS